MIIETIVSINDREIKTKAELTIKEFLKIIQVFAKEKVKDNG